MNTIKKIRKQVKFYLKIITALIIAITFTSCDDDPVQKDILSPLDLTFNLETNQDQMGDFFGNAMALHDGKVWSSGGDNDYTNNVTSDNQIWSSTNGVAWISVTGVGEARTGHTLTTFDGKLWMIGGENNDDEWLSDIWYSSDGSAGSWVNAPTTTAPFGIVAYHTTAVYNGKMYVIAAKESTNATEVWSTSDCETWTQETANAFSGRVRHKAVVFNNTMYVIGGEDIGANKLNEIWQSTDGANWSLVSTNSSIFPGRLGHTATVYNDKVWVIGGRTETEPFTNDIYYSDNLIDWTKHTDYNPIDEIGAHEALLHNDALWVFGGKTGDNDTEVTGKIWSVKED
ncbi:hypothetical protein JBL43_03220 [Aureibaculum sp. A20]|uniref:Galactose oxidase n=1 Tax=Aureibaculum flavum TaxID=2795986 RepID=A0ABS0WMN2_9FLAO|nr:kelch repeat-containing protein [Aureibaculum flavum]MBJ2173230.1 hypothetical protein [Aureibaculum flavum]